MLLVPNGKEEEVDGENRRGQMTSLPAASSARVLRRIRALPTGLSTPSSSSLRRHAGWCLLHPPQPDEELQVACRGVMDSGGGRGLEPRSCPSPVEIGAPNLPGSQMKSILQVDRQLHAGGRDAAFSPPTALVSFFDGLSVAVSLALLSDLAAAAAAGFAAVAAIQGAADLAHLAHLAAIVQGGA